MTKERRPHQQEVALYIDQARRMLVVAAHNLNDGFYASAINRAYYAIFYAANATLSTQGLSRGKHSGVLSVFRERFIKSGLIEIEYSHIYGKVMDDRHLGDYEIKVGVTPAEAQRDVENAQRFVSRIETYLQGEGWL
jgi:uncharacterized protein (UPF0332 family)